MLCTFLHKRSPNFSNTEKLKNVWWGAGEMTLSKRVRILFFPRILPTSTVLPSKPHFYLLKQDVWNLTTDLSKTETITSSSKPYFHPPTQDPHQMNRDKFQKMSRSYQTQEMPFDGVNALERTPSCGQTAVHWL